MASSKKNQTCPPRPERDRSTAAGRLRAAGVGESLHVLLPPLLVEVDGQKEAGLVLQHRIDAVDARLPLIVATRQMTTDHVVGHRKKAPLRAVGALDLRLLADPSNPFVRAGRRVPGLAGLAALEASRIDVVPSAEQRTEQGNLRKRRRVLIDEVGDPAVIVPQLAESDKG